MLIRPQQALLLARIYYSLFVFKNICTEHYTLEVAGSLSWPNYIGPKREKG